MTKPPLDRAIAAAREATGTRWCIGCAKHRQTDGGKVRIGGKAGKTFDQFPFSAAVLEVVNG